MEERCMETLETELDRRRCDVIDCGGLFACSGCQLHFLTLSDLLGQF